MDPTTAPVVIWLQGGPGSSSLFGMLELHGPIIVRDDSSGNPTATMNPDAWSRKANMLYIDNPTGAGGCNANYQVSSDSSFHAIIAGLRHMLIHAEFHKKLRPSVYFFKQYSQLGFSYTEDTNNGLPTTQADVADDLYEFLVQFFTVFDSYQANDFYAFGESYGGIHRRAY